MLIVAIIIIIIIQLESFIEAINTRYSNWPLRYDTTAILSHNRRRSEAVDRTWTGDVISLCVDIAAVDVSTKHRYNTNHSCQNGLTLLACNSHHLELCMNNLVSILMHRNT